jgi:SAM-dependent methyltransferase
VYGLAPAEVPSARADAIHRFLTSGPACRALRHRRQHFARLVDETAAERIGARVLSMGCGHARELEISAAAREGRLGAFVGFDADTEALATAERDYARLGFSAGDGTPSPRGFDLAYSSGLLDSLDDAAAARLVESLLQAVRPGGRAVVSGFLPGLADAAYLEALMDWTLVFRTEAELVELVSGAPSTRLSEISIAYDDAGTIAYLALRRKRPPSFAVLAGVPARNER